MNNFSVISWREQAIFDEMMKYVSFVLDQYAWFDFVNLLKQQPAGRHVAPLEKHSILIASKPVFALTP